MAIVVVAPAMPIDTLLIEQQSRSSAPTAAKSNTPITAISNPKVWPAMNVRNRVYMRRTG